MYTSFNSIFFQAVTFVVKTTNIVYGSGSWRCFTEWVQMQHVSQSVGILWLMDGQPISHVFLNQSHNKVSVQLNTD